MNVATLKSDETTLETARDTLSHKVHDLQGELSAVKQTADSQRRALDQIQHDLTDAQAVIQATAGEMGSFLDLLTPEYKIAVLDWYDKLHPPPEEQMSPLQQDARLLTAMALRARRYYDRVEPELQPILDMFNIQNEQQFKQAFEAEPRLIPPPEEDDPAAVLKLRLIHVLVSDLKSTTTAASLLAQAELARSRADVAILEHMAKVRDQKQELANVLRNSTRRFQRSGAALDSAAMAAHEATVTGSFNEVYEAAMQRFDAWEQANLG